ncbi:hypothetical protein C8F01DRAFT_1356478 [Mycena amicta]|nr:hypothetical protein C8F01DRAFT_1356478 [Mycena amicta]
MNGKIFALFLTADLDWCLDARRRGTLSLVFQAWRNTLEDTSTLWARILLSSHMRTHFIEPLFKSILIDLLPTQAIQRVVGNRKGAENPSFLQHVAHQLHLNALSITKLIFRTPSYTEWNAFVCLLQHDEVFLSALQHIQLEVSTFHRLYDEVSTPFPWPISPPVLRLILDGASLSTFPIYAYSNLHTLSITGLSNILGGLGPAPGLTLVDALRQATGLRCLRLKDPDIPEPIVVSSPIAFPFLHSLEVECNQSSTNSIHVCGSFVAHLHTPKLTTLLLHLGHLRGAQQFISLNEGKLANVSTLTVMTTDFREYCRHDGRTFLSAMPQLRFLDLSDLSHAPAVGTAGMARTQLFLQLLSDAIAMPSLQTLHIPPSFTVRESITRVLNRQVMYNTIVHTCRRQLPMEIIEDHAHCRKWKYQYREPPSNPDDHSSCACVWSFDGSQMERRLSPSLRSPLQLWSSPNSYYIPSEFKVRHFAIDTEELRKMPALRDAHPPSIGLSGEARNSPAAPRAGRRVGGARGESGLGAIFREAAWCEQVTVF